MTLPAHGTLSRSKHHRCPCQLCRRRSARYDKIRSVKIHRGEWNQLVDAEPARMHVRSLIDRGMSIRWVVATSGVGVATVRPLLYEVGHRSRSRQIRAASAQALLALAFDPALLGGAPVDATGTRRRAQALAVMGWPMRVQAEMAGVHVNALILPGGQRRVAGSTAWVMAELFDQLWDKPGPSGYARKLAIQRGWAPPLAWNDIDDPREKPKGLVAA